MASNFDQDAEDAVLRKIEALLRTADHARSNENEAATAMTIAQKLADAHNIDIAGMKGGEAGGGLGKAAPREDSVFPGGLYPYQRNLYQAIAELNHCLYWAKKGLERGQKYRHRLVGSKVNVLLSKQMGEYLQTTVERLARDYAGHPSRYFTRDTHNFREGVIDRVIEKIKVKRREDMEEQRRKKAEQEARARHPGAATENALIILDDVILREQEANWDFQHGEGSWAAMKAREAQAQADMARRIEEQKKAQAEFEQWERDNPVEAAQLREEQAIAAAAQAAEDAKYWEKRRKQEERNAARRKGTVRYSYKEDKRDSAGYYAGRRAGDNVSLDRQMGRSDTKRLK